VVARRKKSSATFSARSSFSSSGTLDVGPNSSVRLNKFIYDPNRSGGKAVLDAVRVRSGSRPARRAATATIRSRPRMGRLAFAVEAQDFEKGAKIKEVERVLNLRAKERL
jgi:hypothetical protein